MCFEKVSNRRTRAESKGRHLRPAENERPMRHFSGVRREGRREESRGEGRGGGELKEGVREEGR